MLCSEASLVKRDEQGGMAVTLFCRSWSCETCQPNRHRQLVGLAIAGKPDTFITLTSNPAAGGTIHDRARALPEAWRKIVRKAQKRWRNGKIPYLAVFEACKSGEPHLHILARSKWIDQAWLSDQMRDLTGAPIVDIRRVWSARQVSNYVAKYVGKAPGKFGTCKRYWHTRDWSLSTWEREPDPIEVHAEWDKIPAHLSLIEADWQNQGLSTWHRRGTLYGMANAPPFDL